MKTVLLLLILICVETTAGDGNIQPLLLTTEIIVPGPRSLLRYNETVKLKSVPQVVLGCNTTNPSVASKLRWEYKVLEGNVVVDNSTWKHTNNQLNITLNYPEVLKKSKVNLTCIGSYSKDNVPFYQTPITIVNSSGQVSPTSLILIFAMALFVALRQS